MSSLGKLTIISNEIGLSIAAGYNPKELSFDKDAGWTEDSKGYGTNAPAMQFTNGKGIKMTLELYFDLYEDKGDVRPTIQSLLSLVLINKALRRPPLVTIKWGGNAVVPGGDFNCVVNTVNTKYTMFTNEGVPCRATATVTVTEAENISVQTANGMLIDTAGEVKTAKVSPKNATSEQLKTIQETYPDENPVDHPDKEYEIVVGGRSSVSGNHDESNDEG